MGQPPVWYRKLVDFSPGLRRLFLFFFALWQSAAIGKSFLLFFKDATILFKVSESLIADFFGLLSFAILWILYRYARLSIQRMVLVAMAAYASGFLLLVMIPVSPLFSILQFPALSDWLFFAAFGFQILFVFMATCKKNCLESFFYFFLPPFLVYFLYFLAFYPGNMSGDSLIQWKQLTALQFEDWHPVFHTLTQWFFTRFWISPAIVSLFQMTFLAAIFAQGMHYLRRQGVPLPVLFFAVAYMALHPVMGGFVVTLWKDVPYSIALLWLTIIAMKIADTQGKWLTFPSHLLQAGVVVAMVYFFRHNGMAPALVFLATLFFFYGRRWVPVLLLMLLFFGFYKTIKGPLFHTIKAEGGFPGLAYGITHQIAAVAYHNGTISDQHWKFLNKILPQPYWKKLYIPYKSDDLIYLNVIPFINANFNEYVRIWMDIVKKNPEIIANHILQSSSLIWRITYPPNSYFFSFCKSHPPASIEAQFGSKFPELRKYFVEMYRALSKPKYSWFTTRPALYLYLTIIFAVMAWIKSGRLRGIFPLFPVLANALALMLVLPVQDTRFMFPVYLTLPLFLAYSLKPIMSQARPTAFQKRVKDTVLKEALPFSGEFSLNNDTEKVQRWKTPLV